MTRMSENAQSSITTSIEFFFLTELFKIGNLILISVLHIFSNSGLASRIASYLAT